MDIGTQLPQFNNKPTLLVVCGAHYAIIYHAMNGRVEKIEEIKREVPEYSDNEGMFKSSTSEGAYGSVLESTKNEETKKLALEIADKLKSVIKETEIGQIYLFTSPGVKGFLDDAIDYEITKIILMSFSGNYTSQSPVELIEMIDEELKKGSEREPTGEAKEILEKTDDISDKRVKGAE